MRTGALAGGAVAVAALALIGALIAHRPAPPPSGLAPGFALASRSIALPADDGTFPAGPHVDIVAANCAACHSPSMVLSQPPLTPEQWRAEVKKMREVYRAPIAEADVPAILDYLTALSAPRR